MPRIKALRASYIKTDATNYIQRELADKHVNISKLTREMKMPRSTFYNKLTHMTFTIDELAFIFDRLRTSERDKVRLLKW